MKKNIAVKVMAFLALFGIIIGVVGTAAIMIFGQPTQEVQQVPQEEKIFKIDTNISGTGETK